MSVTYTDDRNEALREDTFVPVYARTKASRARKGGVRSWMIMAPIGALVIGGAVAAMMLSGGDVAPAPLAEPAATAPVLPATPAPMAMEPAPVDSTPTPVVREATPAPAPAPVRRAVPRVQASAPVQAPAATPAPRVVTPAPTPSPMTSTLNSAPATPAPVVTPAPTPAPVTPPPAIVVEPLG